MKNPRLFATILGGAMFVSALFPPSSAGAATGAYVQDLPVTVAGVPLRVMSGSVASNFSVDVDSLSVTVPNGEAFELRTVGNHRALDNDGVSPSCDVMRDLNNRILIVGPRTVVVRPSAVSCSTSDASVDDTASFTFSKPSIGLTVMAPSEYQLFWSAEGRVPASVRIRLSVDGGSSYPTVVADNLINGGYLSWSVPSMPSAASARLKIEAWEQGSILAFSVSDLFSIAGIAPAPVSAPSSSTAPRSYADFVPSDVTAAAASIDEDRSYPETAAIPGTTTCVSGMRIKGASSSAVYYCGRDLKRHPFPSQRVHDSWFSGFAGVVTVTDVDLARIPLGSNITYRPGTRMIKIQTDPRVYVVGKGGILRAIPDEATASAIYGANWNRMIDDVSDAFFVNYAVGQALPTYVN